MAATLLPIPTAAGEAEPTHQLVQDVYFYTRPPDGQLRAGTTWQGPPRGWGFGLCWV